MIHTIVHQRNRGRLVFTEIHANKQNPTALSHPTLRLRHNLTKHYLKNLKNAFVTIHKVDSTVVSDNGYSLLYIILITQL